MMNRVLIIGILLLCNISYGYCETELLKAEVVEVRYDKDSLEFGIVGGYFLGAVEMDVRFYTKCENIDFTYIVVESYYYLNGQRENYGWNWAQPGIGFVVSSKEEESFVVTFYIDYCWADDYFYFNLFSIKKDKGLLTNVIAVVDGISDPEIVEFTKHYQTGIHSATTSSNDLIRYVGGEIFIDADGIAGRGISGAVYGADGRKVANIDSSTQRIPTSGWHSGVYMVHIRSGREVATKKILVK